MRRTHATATLAFLCWARLTCAQSPPPPADDTPSFKFGAVLFPDYTYTINPKATDSDGNSIHLSQFNLTRAYLDVTGTLSHIVGFRVTPDVARETSAFSNISGSVELRIQYAYLQVNLDDWMTKGSFVRFGIQQTPWLDFAESIYRYRFQGPMFAEREGYLSVADAGASFRLAFPSNYGDVQVGVYNGEGFNKAEVNNEKSLQVRGTLRPFGGSPATAAAHGLRASIFYDADGYVKNGPRHRLLGAVTFEHPILNAGVELLHTADRTTIIRPEIDGSGYSIWVTPRTSNGVEGLLRYDHMKPSTLTSAPQVRNRTIAGVAFWFPHQGTVASALLLDYDAQVFERFIPAQPKQSKLAVHGLVSF